MKTVFIGAVEGSAVALDALCAAGHVPALVVTLPLEKVFVSAPPLVKPTSPQTTPARTVCRVPMVFAMARSLVGCV